MVPGWRTIVLGMALYTNIYEQHILHSEFFIRRLEEEQEDLEELGGDR